MSVKMTIGIANCAIEITDVNNYKKGGNVRARGGRRLLWECEETIQIFDLEFKRIDDGDGAVGASPDWPFISGDVQPDTATFDQSTGTVTGATQFIGRLANDEAIFKYSVTVTPTGSNTAPPLDPVIIVGR